VEEPIGPDSSDDAAAPPNKKRRRLHKGSASPKRKGKGRLKRKNVSDSGSDSSSSSSSSDSDSDSSSDSDSGDEAGRASRRSKRASERRARREKARAKASAARRDKDRKKSAYGSESDGDGPNADDKKFLALSDDDAELVAEYSKQKKWRDEEVDGEFEDDGRGSKRRRRDEVDESHLSVVDRALRGINKRRSRGKKEKMTEEEKEETAKRILYRLEEAADKDLDAVREKKPGLHKLRTLKFALATCSRRDLQETLLAFNLCGVLQKWIEPLPDGGLTSLDLRTRMYKLLGELPILSDHLVSSGLGKAVMRLCTHRGETQENRATLKRLVESWMRPVFQKTNSYRDLGTTIRVHKRDAAELRQRVEERAEKQRRAQARGKHLKAKLRGDDKKGTVKQPGEKGFRWHPKMQAPVVLKYKVKPQKKKLEERGRRYGMSEKQQILEKRLNKMRRPQRKDKTKVRMVGMSIEGRTCK
jgi:transcription factor SPN1